MARALPEFDHHYVGHGPSLLVFLLAGVLDPMAPATGKITLLRFRRPVLPQDDFADIVPGGGPLGAAPALDVLPEEAEQFSGDLGLFQIQVFSFPDVGLHVVELCGGRSRLCLVFLG